MLQKNYSENFVAAFEVCEEELQEIRKPVQAQELRGILIIELKSGLEGLRKS